MKVQIIFSTITGGQLDRQTIEVPDPNSGVSEAIFQAMEAWILGPGDIIKIIEVE